MEPREPRVESGGENDAARVMNRINLWWSGGSVCSRAELCGKGHVQGPTCHFKARTAQMSNPERDWLEGLDVLIIVTPGHEHRVQARIHGRLQISSLVSLCNDDEMHTFLPDRLRSKH